MLSVYWLCINKRSVHWQTLKVMEAWRSFMDKERTSLMVRLDVPTSEQNLARAMALAKGFVAELSRTIPLEQVEYLFGKLK